MQRGSILLAVALCACDPFHTTFEDVEDAVMYEAAVHSSAPAVVTELKIVTWNVKFAGGRLRFFWECNGERGNMTRSEVEGNLRLIATAIDALQPDLLILNEVDRESKRCAYIDNVQWLLDNTDLNFGAYASQWKADFIPSDGLGRMDSGNAILSRWPFAEAERLALPLIEEQGGLTQYFFLRRNMLRASVNVPGHPGFTVLGTHTSAFSDDGTKLRQLQVIQEECERLDAAGVRFVAAGDLNSLPPGSDQVERFAEDEDCTDARFEPDGYSGKEDWMNGLYNNFRFAIPLADYQVNNQLYFTFTGDENFDWNRKLDYLWTNGTWLFGSGVAHQSEARGGIETILLSDHAPVAGVVLLP